VRTQVGFGDARRVATGDPHAGFAADAVDIVAEGDVVAGKAVACAPRSAVNLKQKLKFVMDA
jgi:hypothetical protein